MKPITVIMPVRNEASFIEASLRSVLAQTFDGRLLEVIVVDGNSSDDTPQVVHRVMTEREHDSSASPVRFIFLVNKRSSVSYSLNMGLERATGDIIVRVDGHCELPPRYIESAVRLIEATGAGCAGGVVVSVASTPIAEAIGAAQTSRFGVGAATFRTGASGIIDVDTLAFGAYRREVFSELGGFDPQLVRNQDDEFSLRMVQAGFRIVLDPSLRIRYHNRASLASLAKQYYQYGYFKVLVARKRRALGSVRQLAPPALVLSVVCIGGAGMVTGRWIPALAPATLYLGGVVAAGTVIGIQTGARPYLVMAALMALHLPYGVGYIAGALSWLRPSVEMGSPPADPFTGSAIKAAT